jgi:hypothetical protein
LSLKLSVDADYNRVVEDSIKHRDGQHAVAGERAIPTGEGEVRSEDHRAAFVALRYDLKNGLASSRLIGR